MQAGQKLKKSELTATRILDAAAACIAQQGIECTTTRTIAAKAGVANGLVNKYFPKTDEIFEKIILHIARQAYLSIESPSMDASPREKALHTVGANFKFFFSRPDYFKCFILFYYYASFRPHFRKLNHQLVQRVEERLASYLTEYFKLRGLPCSEAETTRQARTLHNAFVTSIMKYHMTNHRQGQRRYEQQGINDFAALWDALVSSHPTAGAEGTFR